MTVLKILLQPLRHRHLLVGGAHYGVGSASPTVALAGGETLACPALFGALAFGDGVADLVSTAADCRGVGSGSRPAADGFGACSGTARLATRGTGAAGGCGVPHQRGFVYTIAVIDRSGEDGRLV